MMAISIFPLCLQFCLILSLIQFASSSFNNRNNYYDNSFQENEPRKRPTIRKTSNLAADGYDSSQQYYDSDISIKSKRKYYDDQHTQEDYPVNKNRGDFSAGRKQRDIVGIYTATFTSKLLVSVVSSIAVTLLLSLITKMLIAITFPLPLSIAMILITLISCYTKSDFGDFSKSFGVLVLLIAQKIKLTKFVFLVFQKVLSSLSLAKRTPFPPTDNPWKYTPDTSVENPLQFNMMQTLICVGVSGAYIGLLLAKPIPLFPGWLGALLGGAGCAYFGTLRDGKGDLTRFLGSSTLSCLSHIKSVSDDVALTSKALKLWRRVSYYALKLDKQYAIVSRLKHMFGWFIALISVMINRVKRDMGGASGAGTSTAEDLSQRSGFPVDESVEETNLSYTLEDPSDYRKPPPPPPSEYVDDSSGIRGEAARGIRRGTRASSKSYY